MRWLFDGRLSWAVVWLPEVLRESREDFSDHLAMVREKILLGEDVPGLEHPDFLAPVSFGLHLRESREVCPEDGEDVAAPVLGVNDREVILRQGHTELLLQLPNGATFGRLRLVAPAAGQLPEDRCRLLGVPNERDSLGCDEENCDCVSLRQGTPPFLGLWKKRLPHESRGRPL